MPSVCSACHAAALARHAMVCRPKSMTQNSQETRIRTEKTKANRRSISVHHLPLFFPPLSHGMVAALALRHRKSNLRSFDSRPEQKHRLTAKFVNNKHRHIFLTNCEQGGGGEGIAPEIIKKGKNENWLFSSLKALPSYIRYMCGEEKLAPPTCTHSTRIAFWHNRTDRKRNALDATTAEGEKNHMKRNMFVAGTDGIVCCKYKNKIHKMVWIYRPKGTLSSNVELERLGISITHDCHHRSEY